MSYYRHINNGEGPVKLIIGGIHGNEGQTTINLVKLLKKTDFSIVGATSLQFNEMISPLHELFSKRHPIKPTEDWAVESSSV